MKLNAGKFGLATANATAIVWVVCSLIIWVIPDTSMHMGGYMIHADLSAMRWQMHLTGFLLGLILWWVVAGVFAWLLAAIYNRMS